MKETDYKIGQYAMVGLLTMLVATTAILSIPFSTIKTAGHDGWISMLFVAINAALLIYVLYRLSQLFPGLSLIQYLPLIVGKIAGKTIGFGYILFILYLVASVVKESMALFYGTGIFRLTPQLAVTVMLMIIATYAVASGIEVMSRVISLYWVYIFLVLIIFVALLSSAMDFRALLPVGEAGLNNILQASLLPNGFQGELFVIAMLFPYCRNSREGMVAAQIANLVLMFFIVMAIISCITTLGVGTSSRELYGFFILADYVKPVGIKIILVTIWVVAFWCKVALLQFVLTDGLVQLVGLKAHRPVIIPLALIIGVFSMTFYRNIPELFESIPTTFPGAALIFEYLIPFSLLALALIKRKFTSNSVGTNQSTDTSPPLS